MVSQFLPGPVRQQLLPLLVLVVLMVLAVLAVPLVVAVVMVVLLESLLLLPWLQLSTDRTVALLTPPLQLDVVRL